MVAIVAGAKPWTWSFWSPAGRFVVNHPTVTTGLAGLLLIVAGTRRPRRTGSSPIAPPTRPPSYRRRWLLSDPGIATVVTTVAVVGVAALLWMLHVASQVPENKGAGNRYALSIDAIKYGLGSIAAGGAAAALLLAMRRQRLAEHTAERNEEDATHRRVTELYTKAAEQLGHEKAAVRLAGLYALERVGQDNPDQRQTIIDVLCAYLRMPFTPPSGREPARGRRQSPTDGGDETSDRPSGPDPRQELQVRLTAQRIITKHLRRPAGTETAAPGTYWTDIDLDLTGATLIAWNLDNCHLRTGAFRRAIFTDNAGFNQAAFTGTVSFDRATFTDNAWFNKSAFTGTASFDQATFTADAWFRGAIFTGNARFNRATFIGNARFSEATFTDDAAFTGATFLCAAWFGQATFLADAWFGEARASLPRRQEDSWPAGWRLESDPGDAKFVLVVRTEPVLKLE